MERVSQVLQLLVIVEGRRPFARESQLIAPIECFLPATHLRRINSRISLNKGAGGAASFLFKTSLRWRSARWANFPAGSLSNVSILT